MSPESLQRRRSTNAEILKAKKIKELHETIKDIEREGGRLEPLPTSERRTRLENTIRTRPTKTERISDNANLVLRADVPAPMEDERKRRFAKKNLGAGKWTINPRQNYFCNVFDQFIAFSLLYTALVTPYEIGFLSSDESAQTIDTLFIVGNLINLVFIVDVGLNFFLQYEVATDHGMMFEGNHRLIVKRYLLGSFFVDFLSSVPWGFVEMAIGGGGALTILRLLRLLRLLKLLRMIRGSRLIEKYRAEITFSFAHITLFLYVFIIIVFAHWVACLWGYTAAGRSDGGGWIHNQGLQDSSPFYQCVPALPRASRWHAAVPCRTCRLSRMSPFSFSRSLSLFLSLALAAFVRADFKSPLASGAPCDPPLSLPLHRIRYVVSIYFAVMTITTVGYGDVTPTNRDEYIVVTVIMILGGFLWAYVIGGICNVVSSMNVDTRQFQQDFDRVNAMLDDLGMPASFCVYVRRYLFNAETMLRRNTYDDLITLLTPHQQREIAVHRSRANLVTIPYFRDMSSECVLKIYAALTQMVYAPQETMDLPHTLYIIANQGVVAKGGMVFSRGSCINADFILDDEDLFDDAGVGVALTFVQCECLHLDVLNGVLSAFPKDAAVVRKSKIRISFLRRMLRLAAARRAILAAEQVSSAQDGAGGESPGGLELVDMHLGEDGGSHGPGRKASSSPGPGHHKRSLIGAVGARPSGSGPTAAEKAKSDHALVDRAEHHEAHHRGSGGSVDLALGSFGERSGSEDRNGHVLRAVEALDQRGRKLEAAVAEVAAGLAALTALVQGLAAKAPSKAT